MTRTQRKGVKWTPTEWVVLAIFFTSLVPYLWDFATRAFSVTAMPAEFRRAEVNSSSWKTVSKFFQVHSR